MEHSIIENDLLRSIPTLDSDVRITLQKLNQPQTHYGEDNSDRRERLIELIVKNDSIRETFMELVDNENKEEDVNEGNNLEEEDEEEFYTPGLELLYDVRVRIADHSLKSAKTRIKIQQDLFNNYDEVETLKIRRKYLNDLKSNLNFEGSQLISNRFTSKMKFHPNSKNIACGSWNGSCYLVSSETLDPIKTFDNLHPEKISGLDFSKDGVLLTTGGSDGKIKLISKLDEVGASEENLNIKELDGHLSRISELQFHPINDYLTSASHDLTWRLWDVNTSTELYYQEGHTKGLNTLSNHPDGSLLATAGIDSIIKVWDLRSGKSVLNLSQNGHIDSINSLDWSKNGYELASAGSDSKLIIWDIRMGKNLNNILAHNKLISEVKFSSDNKFLISVGYDGSLCLISCDNWLVVKKFNSLDKLMCCDISVNNDKIITGGWDRSIKLYSL